MPQQQVTINSIESHPSQIRQMKLLPPYFLKCSLMVHAVAQAPDTAERYRTIILQTHKPIAHQTPATVYGIANWWTIHDQENAVGKLLGS